jgi:hypothetical protein
MNPERIATTFLLLRCSLVLSYPYRFFEIWKFSYESFSKKNYFPKEGIPVLFLSRGHLNGEASNFSLKSCTNNREDS